MEDIAFILFASSSVFYVIHFGLYLTGANLYDIWQYRRHHRQYKKMGVFKPPLVTVAIAAHNEEKVILRCLKSIAQSTYKKVQIVVVDDGSRDKTYDLVVQYKKEHPELDISIARKRKNVGKGTALNYGLQEFALGDLVMTLDADSIITPNSIGNAVSYFGDPAIAGVAANVQIIEERSVLGLLQKFEHMVGYRSKKTYSLANCEFVVGGVASTYRMDILRKVGFYDTDTLTEDIGLSMKIISNGNRAHRLVYAADVVAMTEGVQTFKALLKQRYRWKYGSLQNIIKHYNLIGHGSTKFTPSLTIYRMPTAIISEFLILCAPVIWIYNISYIVYYGYFGLLVGAYLTITAYTFITLWWDEHTKFKDRLRLSIYMPFVYFMFYIMDFVQLVAVIRCLGKSQSLITSKSVGGTWTSPTRVGRDVVPESEG